MVAIRPEFAWIDGRIVPFSEARVPLDDRGLQFGESLYEVLPITAGAARLLPEHVLRLERAAVELGIEAGAPSLDAWRGIVDELLARVPFADALLYAQLTGGSAPREHVPGDAPTPTFFAYLTAFTYPRDVDVLRGIRAVTLPDLRWARRDLKTTMLLPAVLAKKEAGARGASEALLVGPDGTVNEGASSNVFAVERGAIVTPAQSTSLLPGTMRPLVCEVAREAGLEVRAEALSVDRLAAADEAFITSTSQLVMPIVTLDDRPIGSGQGGAVARDLARRLRLRFELPD
jgi:D-alanine transaminase